MSFDIKIEGLEKVFAEIDGVLDVAQATKSMNKACALITRSAMQKAQAPNKVTGVRGTGELARSIAYKVEVEPTEIVGTVYTPLEYAPYVEFGTGLFAENGDGRKDVPWHYKDDKGEWHTTSGMKPKPFLRPALDENRENIKRIFKVKGALTNE